MTTPKGSEIPDEILIAAEAAKPSSEPGYWAKRSCKHCYGTGVSGTAVVGNLRNELTCSCASKKFLQWRADWIKANFANLK